MTCWISAEHPAPGRSPRAASPLHFSPFGSELPPHKKSNNQTVQITNVAKQHPIEMELAQGNRYQLEKKYTKSVKPSSSKTKRDQHWRALETVELWVLKHC